MISNLLPHLNHHYGEIANKCFTPSAVDQLNDCRWDPSAGTIIGTYDEEINFLDEDDLMAQYISTKTPLPSTTPSTPSTSNLSLTSPLKSQPPLNNTAYGNDEDSVSTLGQHPTRKWSAGQSPSPLRPPLTITNTLPPRRAQPPSPSDERSIESVSTLNTRVNSIEGHMQDFSGTMEHIKNMLSLLTNPKTTQDGDPRFSDTAGQGNLAGDTS